MWAPIYERLIQYASEGKLAAELSLARQEYLNATGELFESDSNFERRMAAFLEWYTLARKLDSGQTPLEHFARQFDSTLSVPELQAIRTLQHSEQSLFELMRMTSERVELRDRFAGRTIVLGERGQIVGLTPGDLILGRIIQTDSVPQLTEGTTFLPRQARKAVVRAAQKLVERRGPRQERHALLVALTFCANRAERYRHVDAATIFANLEAPTRDKHAA